MSAATARRLFYAGLSLAVLGLDQWSKNWAATRLRVGPDVDVIPGLLRFTYAENPGIAFSFLNSGAQTTRWGLAAFSSLAALVVVGFALRTPAFAWRLQTTFAFLFAGIVGNLIDRVRTGRVIDFVDAYVSTHHWPTFNVADSAITVGAIFLALELFRHEEPARSREATAPEEG